MSLTETRGVFWTFSVPEQFEADLQLLQENGFTVVSLDQVVRHLP